MTNTQEKTKTITFRTSRQLKKDLEEMAEGEMRNLSNLIEVILTREVEAYKKKKK